MPLPGSLIRQDARVDDNGALPYSVAFTLGPALLLFATWVLPGRIRAARRRPPPSGLNDFYDVWFPTAWAAMAGLFGVLLTGTGLLRLLADLLHRVG